MFTEYFRAVATEPAASAGDRVLTVDEVAQQFCVSTKTVSRWRQLGLVGRRQLFDGRKRIGFLQSSVDRFAADNAERVRYGARFTRLTDEQRTQLIERAQCLARAGGYLAEVGRQIAQETGRSMETIRYTLNRFDQEHPDMAIFPYNHGLLRSETKWQVYQEHRRGEPVETLARQFCQTRQGIHHIINEVRAARIMELPLDCIDNEQFASLCPERIAREILAPLPACGPGAKKPRLPSGVFPSYLAQLYEVPLLTRDEEARLFRKMNYLKFQAGKLRETLDLERPIRPVMDRIEKLYDESVATKNQIIRANLRLVVSIAKRYVGPAEEFFELVSDGNLSLIRAVEKFDVSRGNRFSTYATWAIMRNFARSIPAVLRERDRFRSGSEIFSTTEDKRTDQYEQESAQIQRESNVERLLSRLDVREHQIITDRFGLARGQEPLTLKQVGAGMGVTKERIRQIQVRAMNKMREAAEHDPSILTRQLRPLPAIRHLKSTNPIEIDHHRR